MAAKFLVFYTTFLFATTQSQRCNGIPQNQFTSQTSILQPSQQTDCGSKSSLNLDPLFSQNGGSPRDIALSLLQGTNIGGQSFPGISCFSSNNGASCSCNDNSIFIPCETPLALNIDIRSGTVSSLGPTVTKVSSQSGSLSEFYGSGNLNNAACVSSFTQNNALNSATLGLESINVPYSSSVAQNNALNGACAQFQINSGSICASGSNRNLPNTESNYLSGSLNSNLRPNNINLRGSLQPCLSNSGSNNFVQTLQPHVCNSAIPNTPSFNTIQNSQTITITPTNVIDKECSPSEFIRTQTIIPTSSFTQNLASNCNPNFISNQPTVISTQINSLPTVSSPRLTPCVMNVQPPSIPSSKSISCPNSNIASVNIRPLPSNPFSHPCNSVLNGNIIKSTVTSEDSFNAPSLNCVASPFSSSNNFNSPCNIRNTNTDTPSFIAADIVSQSAKVTPCINTPSINLGVISLSSNTLNSPCTVPSNSIVDNLITQSASPIVPPFPNIQTVNSAIEPCCNNLALSSINSNRPNIQTIQVIPCECTTLSAFGSKDPSFCDSCRFPTSLSSNQISALNLASRDNICNINSIQTNPIMTNCKSSSNTITLPIYSNNIPSAGCQVTSSPRVLPQVITSNLVDLQNLNLLSPSSQCNPISVASYTNQPTILPTINPPILSSTSTPVIATTIIDNTVSNSLANALQLIIVSNLIQSLNNPSTLPANNVATAESLATSTSVYSEASDTIATGADLSSINVASAAATTSTVDAYLPNQAQNGYADGKSYNQFTNGYQEPYYPSFYDILAQSLFENYPPTGSLAPIASKILGLPNPNIPYDNNYYNGPYDHNLNQNPLNQVPDFYPEPNFYRGPEIYHEPNFYEVPEFYPETNNFYGPAAGYPYPSNIYNSPEFYPEVNNFYAVPEMYADSSNFYNTPEVYGDVPLDNLYGSPESYVDNVAEPYILNDISANAYASAAVDEDTNFYAAPDLSASAIAYVANDLDPINSISTPYSSQLIENPEVTLYSLPESNVPISNPTYTSEPISIPTYNYIDNCPSLSIQSPAEVYLPSNLYPSNSFAPSPFYIPINQREIANPLSAVTPVAAEILIPSEFPANLVCDLSFARNSLPDVKVGNPWFEIEADFSKLFGNGCYC